MPQLRLLQGEKSDRGDYLMRIALDAMGGDRAPGANISGAIQAAEVCSEELILVGDEERIKEELKKRDCRELRLSIEPSTQVVEMHESPSSAIRRKPDSSIVKAVLLIKEGKAEVMVSPGNTGAVVAAAKIYLRTLPGVERPAIAAPMPTAPGGVSLLLDVGANVDCKPRHLVQFAIMGSLYAQYVMEIDRPRVGLLNIGSEESKGNELTKAAYPLLKEAPIHFLGNVEGKDIFNGRADVVVCDGFIGNVILKSNEGLAENFRYSLKTGLRKGFWSRVGASLLRTNLVKLEKRLNYVEYGGAPLLGVNGVCIICHGGSSPEAIKNAIILAVNFAKHKINQKIHYTLSKLSEKVKKEEV